MNNLEMAASLSKEEMLNMRMQGLSPFNPADVRKFKSGAGISQTEKIERAKKLFEGSNNLGGAHERDENISDRVGQTLDYEEIAQTAQPATEQDYRRQLNEDINAATTSSSGKVFSTDDLMSFKKPPQQTSVASVTGNAESAKLEGFNISKVYLNSFVLNLQSPSYQNRLTLYKNLQACLKGEEKYKQAPQLLQAYRQGVMQAEQAMLKNLQG
jgi:hypothetical protein